MVTSSNWLVSSPLLPGLAGHHAAPGHRLKQLLNLRSTMHKLVRPELEGWVLRQLYECDQKPPGVGPVHDQSLKQHPQASLSICLCKQVEHAAGAGVYNLLNKTRILCGKISETFRENVEAYSFKDSD